MLWGKWLMKLSILYFNNFRSKRFECFELLPYFYRKLLWFSKVWWSRARNNVWDEDFEELIVAEGSNLDVLRSPGCTSDRCHHIFQKHCGAKHIVKKKKKKRKRKKIKKKKEKYKMNNKNKEKYGLLLPSLVALLN